MAESLSRPPKAAHHFRRVAILFAGGPAPGANAVISTAATSFMRNDAEVVGMKHGYSSLADFSTDQPRVEGKDYITVTPEFLKRTRSGQGIIATTSYMTVQAPELVRVLAQEYDKTIDLWMLMHPDMKGCARVRVFMDFIRDELRRDLNAVMSKQAA